MFSRWAFFGAGVLSVVLNNPAFGVTPSDAVRAAIEHSAELHSARAQQKSAHGAFMTERSSALPVIAVVADATLNQRELSFDPMMMIPNDLIDVLNVDGQPIVIQPKSVVSATLIATAPLVNAQQWTTIRSAQHRQSAAKLSTLATTRRVMTTALLVASELYLANAAVPVVVALLGAHSAAQNRADGEYQAGMMSKADFLAHQLSVAQADQTYALARARQTTAAERFRTVTGYDSDQTIEWPGLVVPAVPTLTEALSHARNRDVIESARLSESSARAMVSAVNLSFVPTLDASLSLSTSSHVAFSDESTFWVGRLTATLPLTTSGGRIGHYQQAIGGQQMASTQLRMVRDQVQSDLRASYDNLDVVKRTVTSATIALGLATENRKMAETAFETGSIGATDLSLVRVAEMSAIQALEEAEHRHQLAQVLVLAHGGYSLSFLTE